MFPLTIAQIRELRKKIESGNSYSTTEFFDLLDTAEAAMKVAEAAKKLQMAHYRVLAIAGSAIDLRMIGEEMRGYGGEFDEAIKPFQEPEGL